MSILFRYNQRRNQRKGNTKMIAKNEIERIALEMLAAGKPVHGKLREILIEMQLREMED